VFAFRRDIARSRTIADSRASGSRLGRSGCVCFLSLDRVTCDRRLAITYHMATALADDEDVVDFCNVLVALCFGTRKSPQARVLFQFETCLMQGLKGAGRERSLTGVRPLLGLRNLGVGSLRRRAKEV